MAPAFLKSEYDDRLARVRAEMAARCLDALVGHVDEHQLPRHECGHEQATHLSLIHI